MTNFSLTHNVYFGERNIKYYLTWTKIKFLKKFYHGAVVNFHTNNLLSLFLMIKNVPQVRLVAIDSAKEEETYLAIKRCQKAEETIIATNSSS